MTLIFISIIVAVIVLTVCAIDTASKDSKKRKNKNDYSIASSGLTLHFNDKKASSVLKSWAKDIEKDYGTVSYSDAIAREREVVRNIEANIWSTEAYNDYQRLAAGTGNVDSAMLLVQYGVQSSISYIMHTDTIMKRIIRLINNCDLPPIEIAFTSSDSDSDDTWVGLHPDLASDDGTTLLVIASFTGCIDVVDYLLEVGASVDLCGSNGMVPIMVAAAKNHHKIIELLVTKGRANINAKHRFAASSALHFAGEMGNLESISALCKLGINQMDVTATGGTALHLFADASINNSSSVDKIDRVIKAFVNDCHILVDVLQDNDTTPLYIASQRGHSQIAEGLLINGAQASFSMPFTAFKGGNDISHIYTNQFNNAGALVLNSEPGNGAEAIHAAAEEGHVGCIKVLHHYGADINSLSMGVTPLHLAVQYNRVDVLTALLSLGASIDMKSSLDGSTPLYTACMHGNAKIAKMLIEANASATMTTRNGGFPLLIASIRGHDAIVRLLLQAGNGAIVNQLVDGTGDSSLIAAVSGNHYNVVKCLLEYGADTSIVNKVDGSAAIHIASRTGSLEIVKLLLEHHPDDVNLAIAPSLTTPLFLSVQHASNLELIEYLISHGGSVEHKLSSEYKSMTALLSAIEKNRLDAVTVLLKHGANVNQGSNYGIYQSPLLLAVVRGYHGIATVLLEHQSACNIMIVTSKDQVKGDTLIEITRKRRDYDMLQILSMYEQCVAVDNV